jgi:hypothetical protein
MGKPKGSPEERVMEFFDKAPIDVARTVHKLASLVLRNRDPQTPKPVQRRTPRKPTLPVAEG